MSSEGYTGGLPNRSLDEIKAMISEIQGRYDAREADVESRIKMDTDGNDLLFIGESGVGHSCIVNKCRLTNTPYFVFVSRTSR